MEAQGQIACIYRMKSSQRAVGIILLGVGTFFLVAFWGGAISGTRDATMLELFVPIAYLLFAGFFTARAYRNFVALSENAVELQSLVARKKLPFDKIHGRRRYLVRGDENSPSVWHLKLEPNDDRFPTLDFEETYRFDEAFYAWFNALPNLDALDKELSKPSNFGLV